MVTTIRLHLYQKNIEGQPMGCPSLFLYCFVTYRDGYSIYITTRNIIDLYYSNKG